MTDDAPPYAPAVVEILTSRVLLRPTDLGRSLRFYEQTVGLAIYREWGSGSSRGVVFFLGGGGLLELSGGGGRPVSDAVSLVLQVRDVHATYERLVRSYELETPAGWPNLEAFLVELADHLKTLHVLRAHPIGQSLRHGAQTGQSLARSEAPVVKAFFAAIDAPIRSYIDGLKGRDDVLGARVATGYRFAGAWSVRLRPGGLHVDHIHPMGWISSAFHVELPAAIENGHEGWLKFGEPGAVTNPALTAEYFVKPKAGTLVLFPSYMWHGTEPFAGDEPRLSIAFDVLPQ